LEHVQDVGLDVPGIERLEAGVPHRREQNSLVVRAAGVGEPERAREVDPRRG